MYFFFYRCPLPNILFLIHYYVIYFDDVFINYSLSAVIFGVNIFSRVNFITVFNIAYCFYFYFIKLASGVLHFNRKVSSYVARWGHLGTSADTT